MTRPSGTASRKPANAAAKVEAPLPAPTARQVAARLAQSSGVWASLTAEQKARALNVTEREVSGRKR